MKDQIKDTATDRIVIRISALCVLKAGKEMYLELLQKVPDDELQSLMDILNLQQAPLTDICNLVCEKDWLPLLKEREHLVKNATFMHKLNLL
jgi:hypothetical protein